ncbi:MAG: sigma-54-dependent Fis family transcriptional regulator [Phycisphaerales bacterium]|nr:MAG: sigma-54-dependent Fis family transcriptional regulator [Phycisphaerales bacterium]
MSTVLVVDDKEMLRDSVGATLQRAGFTVIVASDGAAALETVTRRRPDAVVTDLKMPGLSGVELLEQVRAFDEDLPVVLMTAFGSVETAVKAIKLGAYDYICKPFEGDELVIAVKRAIDHAKLKRENAVLRLGAAPGGAPADGGARGMERVIGDSATMRLVKEQLCAVAESHGNVLICGESGTGKEVVARAIHEMSPRAGEPFLAMNCPALAESLLESELFGHEKGAFTGADRLRKGRFELADKGTLLLDEISEVSPQIQAKLLRVLQEREFERVGSSATIRVDVRVIATTNRDLPGAVREGKFRQDLFFRLNVLPIHLPGLRERREDIPALAAHFVGLIARREGIAPPEIEPDAMARLGAYSWPGNVRELQNLCERAVVLSRGRSICAELVAPWLRAGEPDAAAAHQRNGVTGHHTATDRNEIIEARPAPGQRPAPAGLRTLEEIEREAICDALATFNGHRQRTAEALGIGVRTLGLKLKKWKEQRLVSESL